MVFEWVAGIFCFPCHLVAAGADCMLHLPCLVCCPLCPCDGGASAHAAGACGGGAAAAAFAIKSEQEKEEYERRRAEQILQASLLE